LGGHPKIVGAKPQNALKLEEETGRTKLRKNFEKRGEGVKAQRMERIA